MKDRELKDSTIQHVGEYIANRVSGKNKKDSALGAGYSDSVAHSTSLIENTKTYQILVSEVLTDSAVIMRNLTQNLRRASEDGTLAALPLTEQSQILKIQAQVEGMLRPKITVKQTTDSKGNKTTTAWGTNAPQLHEALGNEG